MYPDARLAFVASQLEAAGVRKFGFRHNGGLETLIETVSHVTAAVSLLNAFCTAGQS